MADSRFLQTRKGAIRFPAYIPVTTFGKKYPLDDLIRPYLPRLASAIMVSYYYAKQQTQPFRLPMLVDSGGFASLFEKACIEESGGLGIIKITNENAVEHITQSEVLDFQEQSAEVAFTLDFPIPPEMDRREAERRLRLTIANAHWALANRRRRDLPLFACIQGWNVDTYSECAKAYVGSEFEGVAIGGLVPRVRDETLVLQVVEAVRALHPSTPLHIFGLGQPALVQKLFDCGVDSVDSSAYVKLAADGRSWGKTNLRLPHPSPTERLHLALTNLANATGTTMPLASMGAILSTHSLAARLAH